MAGELLAAARDGDENGAAIAQWLDDTRDIPGIVGAIYTTWVDKHDAMDAWV